MRTTLLLFLTTLTATNAQDATSPFVESGGLVVIEAESVPPVEPWKFESEYPTYLGDGYLRYDGSDVFGSDGVGTSIPYYIQINDPGEYSMTLRAHKNITEDNGYGNDCYTQLEGALGFQGNNVKTYLQGPANRYLDKVFHDIYIDGERFNKIIPTYQFPYAGIYKFNLSGRSKHFKVDRIIFYKNGLVTKAEAVGRGNPESARASGDFDLDNALRQLVLVDASSDTDIQSLVDGATIDLADTGSALNIVAYTFEVAKVEFTTPEGSRSESVAPFALAGDASGDYASSEYLATPGTKQVTAIAYDESGTKIGETTVSFEVVGEAPVVESDAISGLVLTDAGTAPSSSIDDLEDGDVFQLAEVGTSLSVVANVEGASQVKFFYDGTSWTEGLAPYAMAGNNDDLNFPVDYLSTAGEKMLTVKAYDGSTEIDSLTISFTLE